MNNNEHLRWHVMIRARPSYRMYTLLVASLAKCKMYPKSISDVPLWGNTTDPRLDSTAPGHVRSVLQVPEVQIRLGLAAFRRGSRGSSPWVSLKGDQGLVVAG